MKTQRKRSQQEAMCAQYTKKKYKVAIEFSRKREQEHSTSRTFVRLLRSSRKSLDKADSD